MAEFYPMPPDARKRIEKWLEEHAGETGSPNAVPCVVAHDESDFDVSLLERLAPRRLSPMASASLAAKMKTMRDEPFANELNRWLERKGLDPVAVYKGAGLFARTDARRLFPVSILLAATGALVWSRADGAATYLVGVALFAAGYANVYGFVFAVASARQPPEKASAVAALLTMAIAGGALASPLAEALGMRGAETLAVAATFVLLALSIGTLFASRSRT